MHDLRSPTMPRLRSRPPASDDALHHHEERARHLREAVANERDPNLLRGFHRELAHHARIVSALRAERGTK